MFFGGVFSASGYGNDHDDHHALRVCRLLRMVRVDKILDFWSLVLHAGEHHPHHIEHQRARPTHRRRRRGRPGGRIAGARAMSIDRRHAGGCTCVMISEIVVITPQQLMRLFEIKNAFTRGSGASVGTHIITLGLNG
jgi:hypothetical protein